MSSMEDPAVLLERNLYGHLLTRLLWERRVEKILMEHGWEKVPNWECFSVYRPKELFFSVYVDDVKFAGKKENIIPMWKVFTKQVDLVEPTSFLDHVHLGCTPRQCETRKHIVDNHRTMFESRISTGATEKNYQALKIHMFLRGPTTWKVLPKSVWNDIANWQTNH